MVVVWEGPAHVSAFHDDITGPQVYLNIRGGDLHLFLFVGETGQVLQIVSCTCTKGEERAVGSRDHRNAWGPSRQEGALQPSGDMSACLAAAVVLVFWCVSYTVVLLSCFVVLLFSQLEEDRHE